MVPELSRAAHLCKECVYRLRWLEGEVETVTAGIGASDKSGFASKLKSMVDRVCDLCDLWNQSERDQSRLAAAPLELAGKDYQGVEQWAQNWEKFPDMICEQCDGRQGGLAEEAVKAAAQLDGPQTMRWLRGCETIGGRLCCDCDRRKRWKANKEKLGRFEQLGRPRRPLAGQLVVGDLHWQPELLGVYSPVDSQAPSRLAATKTGEQTAQSANELCKKIAALHPADFGQAPVRPVLFLVHWNRVQDALPLNLGKRFRIS